MSREKDTKIRQDRLVAGVLVGILAVLAAWVSLDYLRVFVYQQEEPRTVTPRAELTALEQTSVELFEKASSSVVFVTTLERVPNFSGPDAARVGMGSGFVWDKAGHIVTNDHVVKEVDRIAVRFGSEQRHTGVVVGRAPDYDLAVIRVQGRERDYAPIPVGTMDGLQVGQLVFAIGNPFGLSRTLTHGMVSALERRIPTAGGREIRGVIQTDAAINPGNSGGPLLDSAGRLIGVNTAIASQTGAFAGVGFAVPVDVVNRVVSELIAHGEVPRPGIGIAALDEALAARIGAGGVVVAEVMPDSPAAAAGLRGIDRENRSLGDVITHAEGQEVASVADLAAVLEEVGIGNRATLKVRRDGESREVEVKVTDISGE